MLLTVSTIKDSPENVGFFVAANLASGVDHMFVFLDAPRDPEQREVATLLAGHPHVTCIPTPRGSWWSDQRPAGLNVRQRINANWTRAVLEPFPWAEWLFHIDGDEVACLDPDAMTSVPAHADAVRLAPWEATSEWSRSGRPTSFKRLLEEEDLNLLHVLGAIQEPTNQAYFHGHVKGKAGVRPRSGLGLTLHEAVLPDGRVAERHEDPRLHVLHYDAPSGEEFIRKWTALAGAGHARYRPSRAPSARALRRLASSDLPEGTRTKYLRRIYDLTTRDDVGLLAELDLLVHADPERAVATPRRLPPEAAEQLAHRVSELSPLAKGDFHVGGDPRQDGAPRGRSLRERARSRVRKG
jgi:hypothetical protein